MRLHGLCSCDHGTFIETVAIRMLLSHPLSHQSWFQIQKWHLSFHEEVECQCGEKKSTKFVTLEQKSDGARGQTGAMRLISV